MNGLLLLACVVLTCFGRKVHAFTIQDLSNMPMDAFKPLLQGNYNQVASKYAMSKLGVSKSRTLGSYFGQKQPESPLSNLFGSNNNAQNGQAGQGSQGGFGNLLNSFTGNNTQTNRSQSQGQNGGNQGGLEGLFNKFTGNGQQAQQPQQPQGGQQGGLSNMLSNFMGNNQGTGSGANSLGRFFQ